MSVGQQQQQQLKTTIKDIVVTTTNKIPIENTPATTTNIHSCRRYPSRHTTTTYTFRKYIKLQFRKIVVEYTPSYHNQQQLI